MGLNAITEFGRQDEDVTRISRDAARVLRQALMHVLTRQKTREKSVQVEVLVAWQILKWPPGRGEDGGERGNKTAALRTRSHRQRGINRGAARRGGSFYAAKGLDASLRLLG
jgi:hypothetical protein